MVIKTVAQPYRKSLRITSLNQQRLERLWQVLAAPFPSESNPRAFGAEREIILDRHTQCDEPADVLASGSTRHERVELRAGALLEEGTITVTVSRALGTTSIWTSSKDPVMRARAEEVHQVLSPWQIRRWVLPAVYLAVVVAVGAAGAAAVISLNDKKFPVLVQVAVLVAVALAPALLGYRARQAAVPFAYDSESRESLTNRRALWIGGASLVTAILSLLATLAQ